jgi:CheY-like chemotaxis protein
MQNPNLVMLVDDNETDNFINQRIIDLAKFSKRVVVHNSGKSALEYLEKEESNIDNLPEMIFLDINMPIVDGFVFLFEFEQLSEVVRSKCKICVLSSSDNHRDIERITSNEFVIEFITKPLTVDALNSLLGK